MMKSYGKTLLLVVKLSVAVVMLAWVLSKTHWRNYVVTDSGKSYAVTRVVEDGGQKSYVVSAGLLWWAEQKTLSAAELKPLGDGLDGVYERVGFASSIAGIHPWLLAAAIVGFLVIIVITGLRWWMLLRIQNIHISLREIIRLTFLGQFFNYVVPGTVGGDLIKAYYVSKHTDQKAAVLVSLFTDRLLGFTELTLMAATMIVVVLVLRLPGYTAMREPGIAIVVVLGVVVVMLAFLLSRRFRAALHLQKIYHCLPIAHHIEAAGNAAKLYRERIGVLARAIGITVGAHACLVISIFLIGLSLSIDVPWYSYFIYVPLIYIVGAIPVTPGGVGLVEGLFQAFFVTALGCGASEILALALLARVIPMFWGLPGAVVAVTGPKLPKTQALQAELGIAEDPQ